MEGVLLKINSYYVHSFSFLRTFNCVESTFVRKCKKKTLFLLHFAHLFVPLTPLKVLTFGKTQNTFGISLTYSYLCPNLNQTGNEKDLYHAVLLAVAVG